MAKEILQKGGIVVYPTDTLYGLGASIFEENAVKRIYEIKKRPHHIPLPIIVPSVEGIKEVAIVTDIAFTLARKFLPGALTLVLKKRDIISDTIARETIAVRVPDHDIAREIASEVPITATSANIHGGEEPVTIAIAKKQLGSNVDMYIDAGKLPGKPSTIVDVTKEKMKIIREGVIKKERLYGALREI